MSRDQNAGQKRHDIKTENSPSKGETIMWEHSK